MKRLDHRIDGNGLPVGLPVPDWPGCGYPDASEIKGRLCRLERLSAERHGKDLFAAFSADAGGRDFTYLPYGPFASLSGLETWMRAVCTGSDPLFFAIADRASGKAVGCASYLNIVPLTGSIEIGHIHFSPFLQKSGAATESMFLMMRLAMSDLGYRRLEWKCDALNARSCRAAERLGFAFEGIFRNATIYKRRNRDTAWYSIIDSEWPDIRDAFESWLDPKNFDSAGAQLRPLRAFMDSRRAG